MDKIDRKGCIGPPELVVEILSSRHSRKELHEKFEVYQEAGVLEYWLVHPEEKMVLQYIPNDKGKFIAGQPYVSAANSELSTAIAPDLSISLNDIFYT